MEDRKQRGSLAEVQFLNLIVDTGNTELITMNNLTDDYFPNTKEIFNFIKKHIEDYNSVPDEVTLLASFPHFSELRVSVTEPVDYLLEELHNSRTIRYLADNYNKMKPLLEEGDAQGALDLLVDINDGISGTKRVESVNILEDISRFQNYLTKKDNFNNAYIKTGISELDALICGWDRTEELATIVARPGVGKSWLLIKSAVAAVEQGYNVGFYSGEMSVDKVAYRFDTWASHISNYSLTRGNFGIRESYEKYINSLRGKYNGAFHVLTPTMLGKLAGVNDLRAFIEKENLDILFIDQHSLMEDDRKARNPIEKASNISKDLKSLQVLKKIPIIAASQQNRATTENGVDVSNVAQSDRIGQDSTLVLFIERDKESKQHTIHLVKSRDSETGKSWKYTMDFDKGIIQNIPEDDLSMEAQEAIIEEFGEEDIY